ncbi:hypothetical protein A2U01_0007195 [Trifolium medium]|uniref:Uncharacterized protein n=1 Tax=Trifolium medium TaxID=97028 RepID=A0A392MFR5_9FABA|nr:hypothetical protein [Trifolium medium]
MQRYSICSGLDPRPNPSSTHKKAVEHAQEYRRAYATARAHNAEAQYHILSRFPTAIDRALLPINGLGPALGAIYICLLMQKTRYNPPFASTGRSFAAPPGLVDSDPLLPNMPWNPLMVFFTVLNFHSSNTMLFYLI